MLLKNKQLKFEKKRAGRYIAKPSSNITVEIMWQPEAKNWYVGLLEVTRWGYTKEIAETFCKTKKEAIEWVTYQYLCEFGSI